MSLNCGVVHGRFQPFHKGHLEYVKAALKRCETLFIGITNPDPSEIVFEKADPQRHLAKNNPFYYFERLLMVKNTLVEEGIDLQSVHIVPFPVHHQQKWQYYLPRDAVYYIYLINDWAMEKTKRMREMGLKVETIGSTREMLISAAEVRRRMVEDENWEELVPEAVARIIRKIDGVSRVRSLTVQN